MELEIYGDTIGPWIRMEYKACVTQDQYEVSKANVPQLYALMISKSTL